MFSTAAALRLYQRDSDRMPALPASSLPVRLMPRGDGDCPVKAAMVDALRSEMGRSSPAAWPKATGPHKRLEVGQRWLIHTTR